MADEQRTTSFVNFWPQERSDNRLRTDAGRIALRKRQ
jgi:hypothetical protein